MRTTIRDVIAAVTGPAGPVGQTVDGLLSGDPDDEVKGIVTAFMPSQRVLEEARASGANLVIAHEGPFYSHHLSFAKTIADDPVYRAKSGFIRESGLAVYRLHDHIHRYSPDGIAEGLLEALGWTHDRVRHEPEAAIIEREPTTVRAVAGELKLRLGLRFVRVAGDPDAPCRRIGLLVGYRGGGANAIPLFGREGVDLVICGEGPEWEAPEYARDAARQGRAKALIAIGHGESERPGMRLLARRLAALFPHIPVRAADEEPVFTWL
ncbi:MAG: transcriptional regulator [Thermobacillus sp. ZCTH02-B1]|uniref:Nif3-like dinuclear metal center hexameric protein n=1 Tax=Thermobacillus sp. ZCTH02-B1 TaxID=1858795 RepID=UPI000B5508AE|nr:Nif3-like dinuclear metal center hexameric protein [Thermobacillus sp. ZCTH02-B1]OUM97152.1 MAG: transcriptional regulator [Thermobacillus sp. ZCTH02-B1]